MKRLRKTRAAAHVTDEHFYEAEDEEIPPQKAKFASLYEEAIVADDVAEEEEDDDVAGHEQMRQPRKTCKLSGSKHGPNRHQVEEEQQKRFICPKCGKEFQSSKAMCGHMACHSEKDKASKNVVAKQKPLVMDSHSDTESGAKNRRRRSSRKRKSRADVLNNCSSEASGVEQEEVAISLMMLSRDSANWGGLNSVGDSSDNNSVVLEAKTIRTKSAKMDGLKSSGYGVDEATEKCGSENVKALGDFESGYVRNEAENVETDMKIGNLKRNKLQEGYEGEPHLSMKKLKTAIDGRFKYYFSKDGEERYGKTERPEMDSCLEKRASNVSPEYSSAEMCRRFEHKAPIHSCPYSNAYGAANQNSCDDYNGKTGKHECSDCFKVFRSAQALGSHRMQHLQEGAMCKQNRTQVHDSIDLNLPAPTEDEEASENMGSYGRFQIQPQT